MRAVHGAMPTVLNRRWAETDRLTQLTLPRDRYADEPGDSVTLYFGDRTVTRMAALIADAFGRPDGAVGLGYTTWPGFGDLQMLNGMATPSDLDVEAVAVHQATLTDRAHWAELTIGALSSTVAGGYASVGVTLRATPPPVGGDGYLIVATMAATVRMTRIAKFTGGSLTWLTETPTPWRVGERLRAEIDGGVINVYRQDVRILQHIDADPLMISGAVGLEAMRTLVSDAAAVASWRGGHRRQYVGLAADMGDVSASLGLIDPTVDPARWDITLSNLQAIAGVARVSDLIRHGLNPTGYDVVGAPVRTTIAYRGAMVPLSSGFGKVEGIDGLDEERVKIRCSGPDANLEPRIDGKTVIYLTSTPPFGGPIGLPQDECAPSPPPALDPGPDEPPPAEELPEPPDGEGPEDPPIEEEPGGVVPLGPLLGEWVVDFGWEEFDPEAAGDVPLKFSPIPAPYVQPTFNPSKPSEPFNSSFSKYEGLPLRITMILEKPNGEPPEAGEVTTVAVYRCWNPDPGVSGPPCSHYDFHGATPAQGGTPHILGVRVPFGVDVFVEFPLSVVPPHFDPCAFKLRCSRIALAHYGQFPPNVTQSGKWW
jgi:hypothetical protein